MGLGDRASILDGGLDAWQKAGGAVSTEAPGPARKGNLTPRPRDVTVNADYVATHLPDRKVTLVDARAPRFYDGSDAGGQPRPGHIPGARNIPFVSFMDSTEHFLPESVIRQLFTKAGVTGDGRVVVYCHIGQQATLAYFNARRLGYDIRLYDGSYQEWSRLEGQEVVQLKAARARLIPTEQLGRMVANPEWKVTLIDARSDLGAYLQGHLPGAVFLHNETLRWTGDGVPADLLPAEAYLALFERLGVRRDRPVVIYSAGDQADFHASFIAWLLRGFDHPQVYLLDGGLAKWTAEDRPLTQEYPVVERGSLAGRPFAPALAGTDDVRRAVSGRTAVLVDARPPAQFTGQAGPQIRRGHIPGAISHPWTGDLQGTGGQWAWKKVEELKAAYAAQGITPDREVIVYCNTGTEASHLHFALSELLEYPNVRVYVPSWTAWAAEMELPVE
jgi:thiosulfate/3-mercaptopyruvate sulfurtransferase